MRSITNRLPFVSDKTRKQLLLVALKKKKPEEYDEEIQEVTASLSHS